MTSVAAPEVNPGGTTEGPNASVPYGSVQGLQQNLGPGASAPQGGAPPPNAPPAQQRTGPAPTAQPLDVPPQQPYDMSARLDPSSAFSPPRVPTLPYRQFLRTAAALPGAGVELRALASMVAGQRGPLERGPQP